MKHFMARLLFQTIFVGCFFAGVAQADEVVVGRQADPQAEFESMIQQLLRDAPAYRGDQNGVDLRNKDFEEVSLALLYLSAVREQYAVLATDVDGKVIKSREYIKLHNARHIFKENEPEIFSFNEWMRLYHYMTPSPGTLAKVEIQKLQTFADLEQLRSQLARTLLSKAQASGAQSSAQALAERMAQLIKAFPGNSEDARVRFLKAYYTSLDPDVRALRERLFFDLRMTQQMLQPGEPKNFLRARFFFKMLSDYFRGDYSKKFVFWTKFVPVVQTLDGRGYLSKNPPPPPRRYTSEQIVRAAWESAKTGMDLQAVLYELASRPRFDGNIAIRFFLSDASVFKQQVFEQEIPIEIITSWQGLMARAPKDAESPAREIATAFASIEDFLKRNSLFLSPLAQERTQRAFEFIRKSTLAQGWNLPRKRGSSRDLDANSFIRGSFSLGLQGGTKVDGREIFGAHGIDEGGIGVRRIGYRGPRYGFSAEVDPVKKEMRYKGSHGGTRFSMTNHYGWMAASSKVLEEIPLSDFEGEEFRLRYFKDDVTISTVVLSSSELGKRYFMNAFNIGAPR